MLREAGADSTQCPPLTRSPVDSYCHADTPIVGANGKLVAMTVLFSTRGALITVRSERTPDGKLRSYGGHLELGAGGKVEDGETAEQAARRELKEELGIIDLKLRGLTAWVGRGYVYVLFVGISRDEPRCLDGQSELIWREPREAPLASLMRRRLVPSFHRVAAELCKAHIGTYWDARRFLAAEPASAK